MSFLAKMDAAERQYTGKRAYDLLLMGYDDEAIAEQMDVEVFIVTACREEHIARRIAVPEQNEARKTIIARAEKDLTALNYAQDRAKVSYTVGQIDIEQFTNLVVKLVREKTNISVRYAKYLDLETPLKVDLRTSSTVDRAIEELCAIQDAASEADTPLHEVLSPQTSIN